MPQPGKVYRGRRWLRPGTRKALRVVATAVLIGIALAACAAGIYLVPAGAWS